MHLPLIPRSRRTRSATWGTRCNASAIWQGGARWRAWNTRGCQANRCCRPAEGETGGGQHRFVGSVGRQVCDHEDVGGALRRRKHVLVSVTLRCLVPIPRQRGRLQVRTHAHSAARCAVSGLLKVGGAAAAIVAGQRPRRWSAAGAPPLLRTRPLRGVHDDDDDDQVAVGGAPAALACR